MSPHVTFDPERRQALRAAKLRALVVDEVTATGGALSDTVLSDGDHLFDGCRLWTLASGEAPKASLGTAVLQAGRHEGPDGPVPTVVCVDDRDVARTLARRATALDPSPEVRWIDGRTLVVAEPAESPVPSTEVAPPADFDDLCRGVGVEPVLEHGIWRGEVLGLEVVRVVDDPDVGSMVQIGVGRFDREAATLMQGGRSDAETEPGRPQRPAPRRRTGAGAHPLETLARERWIRRDLCAAPEVVGLADLAPVDPADERPNLRDPSPAPAVGTGPGGERVLVVCSVGVDLHLLGATCELVLREAPDRVAVALPARDVLAPVERAVARLRVPASLTSVPCGWDAA